MTLRVYNTLSGGKEEFVPLEPGKVGMYVCGVTVYDHCHIGHARANVVFDVIYRYLRYLGYDVTYVRNYTDIDDKIINRATQGGRSVFRDIRAVHCRIRPRHDPARSRTSHTSAKGDRPYRRDRQHRGNPRLAKGLPIRRAGMSIFAWKSLTAI